MSKPTVTSFSNRTGSPFQNKTKESSPTETKVVHQEVLQKTQYDKQKENQSDLMQKVNKKTAEYKSNKPSSGVFTEVVTHGAFTSKSTNNGEPKNENRSSPPKTLNLSNGSKSLLGFPSSANDLALDAKSDLESDKNISKEVKEKVIEKLFTLVSMVQHVYESKVRIMSEFEKFKDTHMKNEMRREKEHSEQLYKLNMNFQNEVVQAIQRLKSELDISSNVTKSINEKDVIVNDSSIDFNTSKESQLCDAKESNDEDVNNDDVISENSAVQTDDQNQQ